MRDFHSNAHLARLIARIEARSAVIGIIGLGYVGSMPF